MQQEAPQKLVDVQAHQPSFVSMRRIAPVKGDLVVGKRHQPVIGDSNPMRIAAEIAESVLGPAKRPFGVNHPFLSKRQAQQLCEDLWARKRFHVAVEAELALGESVF
jgi:hypothetical protein